MVMPSSITESLLYKRLKEDAELTNSAEILREKAQHLASTLIRDAETFTDHTVRHMDALWIVAEKVLTAEEIHEMTTAEVFLLIVAFYLHDIGMSYAGTEIGKQKLIESREYKASLAIENSRANTENAKHKALANAIRLVHAQKSEELATRPLPGTSEYLLEPQLIREQFGAICGRIAASHHWSIERVDAELGAQEVAPLAKNRSADLGFVAGILRIIDYAHINRERASRLDLALRPPLEETSLRHWNAQMNIDGPSRTPGDNELGYSASTPIANVDAWWLFYEFARGLNDEIGRVRRFLNARHVSANRLSLVGVRGINSPEEFERFIKTDGFLPLEVNVKTSSITRLVRLLAGESLYGKNFYAPIRELIQNSLDAVLLRRASADSIAESALGALPISVSMTVTRGEPVLEVRDWGIGMTEKIIVDHLLTIASDYWESQFPLDFPTLAEKFSPAGKFGIGFLSVFMLGDEISVSSQRTGSERHKLSMRGLGRRAELRKTAPEATSGTTVSIILSQEANDALKDLPANLPSLVPMLDAKVAVNWNGSQNSIAPRWVLSLEKFDFKQWALRAQKLLGDHPSIVSEEGFDYYFHRQLILKGSSRTPDNEAKTWPLGAPEYVEDNVRLIVDQVGRSLLCLRGFALQSVRTPGFIGVINSSTVTPDAAREKGLDFDSTELLGRAATSVKKKISENLDERAKLGFIPDQLDFIEWCAATFGDEVVTDSEFPWIPTMEIGGNVRFCTTKEFANLISKVDSIFLGINTGPITLSKAWSKQTRSPTHRELGVFFSGGQLGYVGSSESRTGSVIDLWEGYRNDTLFMLFVQLACAIWNISTDALLEMETLRHSGSTICGFWTRQAPP